MHKLPSILSLLASAFLSFAAVTVSPAPVYRYDGPVNEGCYFVKIRDDANQTAVLDLLNNLTGGATGLTHQWDPSFFNGFAGYFHSGIISALQSSADVEFIEEDGIMSAFDIQTNASWNLARMSTRKKLSSKDPLALTYQYGYDPNPGSGVDIYVVDSGIYVLHPDFGGRATWGGAFCAGCALADGFGHGTHVAGIAGGEKSGIAKDANLIAVKVLNDQGNGKLTEIIAGLSYVYGQHKLSGSRPSVATMSFGGANSTSLSHAILQLVKAGIHCTVSAGNRMEDARDTSPANIQQVITVAATDITDSMASYSNFGSVVDVFAPGSNVTSTWNDGKYMTLSGTSMATPAVAGLVAYLLNIVGPKTSPAVMSDHITQLSTTGVLSDIPPGTVNLLAFNGFQS